VEEVVMRSRILLIAALVTSLGFAPAPFPRSGKGRTPSDLERLQGTWEVIEARFSGADIPSYVGARARVVGVRWSFFSRGEQTSHYHWDVEAFPRASPRAMNFNGVDGSTPSQAIYRFDGDTLTLNYAVQGERPTRFDRDRDFYLVLRRVGR
jgi:uncharacterized protein (TIGR03067 family)